MKRKTLLITSVTPTSSKVSLKKRRKIRVGTSPTPKF